MSRTIRIGVIGFGWMGQAHSRGCRRAPSYFLDRDYEPELVVVSDTVEARRDDAVRSFGYQRAVTDWHEVVERQRRRRRVRHRARTCCTSRWSRPRQRRARASSARSRSAARRPQTVAAERAARRAGVITGVGYNYRWAPLVQYAKQLIDDGTLGQITNYYGRFFSMYGSDPMGLLSWRFLVEQAGHGVSTDILSHSVDLGHYLVGGISKVLGTGETFIKQRPLPTGGGTHYDRGKPGDPTGEVTNEDYIGMMCVFENGARGTFEACRSMVGPESQNSFEVYGTKGSVAWNFEKMNELRVVHRCRAQAHRVHDRVRRRSLPAARQLRARQCQRHRLRRPDLHRGPRVPAVGRRRASSTCRASPRRCSTWRCKTPCCAAGRAATGKTSTH